jgi:selenocysteine lyase/cysteine desulfurase
LRPTAARFEGGSQNNAGLIALGASLKWLMDAGIDDISASILEITDRACERLAESGARIVSDRRPEHRGGEQRSGIVAFEFPGRDPLAVKRHSLRQNVVFGCRAGRLRISPHAYNNEADLDRLIQALESFRSR